MSIQSIIQTTHLFVDNISTKMDSIKSYPSFAYICDIASFTWVADQVAPGGSMTVVTVRFQAPRGAFLGEQRVTGNHKLGPSY